MAATPRRDDRSTLALRRVPFGASVAALVEVGGRRQFFPRRELCTLDYSIEDTYAGIYQNLRRRHREPRVPLRKDDPPEGPTFARYAIGRYLKKHKADDPRYARLNGGTASLHGLIRILLFKRFESSVFAFQQTVRRLVASHRTFLQAVEAGMIPTGTNCRPWPKNSATTKTWWRGQDRIRRPPTTSTISIVSIWSGIWSMTWASFGGSWTRRPDHARPGRQAGRPEGCPRAAAAPGPQAPDLHTVHGHGGVPLREPRSVPIDPGSRSSTAGFQGLRGTRRPFAPRSNPAQRPKGGEA